MDESGAVDRPLESPLDFHAELEALVAASPGWLADIGTSVASAFGAGGVLWPAVLLGALLVGIAGERIGCWKLTALNRVIARQSSDRWVVNLGYAQKAASRAVDAALENLDGEVRLETLLRTALARIVG